MFSEQCYLKTIKKHWFDKQSLQAGAPAMLPKRHAIFMFEYQASMWTQCESDSGVFIRYLISVFSDISFFRASFLCTGVSRKRFVHFNKVCVFHPNSWLQIAERQHIVIILWHVNLMTRPGPVECAETIE